MAYVNTQQGNTTQRELVEEKFFAIKPEQARPLIQQAIESAMQLELRELAPGMWVGSKELEQGAHIEVTARAQAVEDGTSVELRLKHHWSPMALSLWIVGLIILSVFILPLIFLIAYGQKKSEKMQQDALVSMHTMWSEISDAIGAPKRASSYRDAPKRIYRPRRVESGDDLAELEAAAEEEQLELEERVG